MRTVAADLGRQFCYFDEYVFETGDQLATAVREGVGKSSIFVLFASPSSLTSPWVHLELKEAEQQLVLANLERVLVYVIDPATGTKDLPAWLQKVLYRRETAAKTIAREIRFNVDRLLAQISPQIFVGRGRERRACETELVPDDGSPPPRLFVLTGLSGIGRRTLCRKVSADLLNLNRLVALPVAEADELGDVVATAASHFEAYTNAGELSSILGQARVGPEAALCDRLVRYSERASTNQELLVLRDEGGLISRDGALQNWITPLLSAIGKSPTAYLAIVTTRKPHGAPSDLPVIRVDPLGTEDMKRLVIQLCVKNEVVIAPHEVEDAVDYLGGYPPAAHYFLRLARQYGVSVILSDKADLVAFRSRYFVPYLANRIRLDPLQRRTLSLLGNYSPLPLAILGNVLASDPAALTSALVALIDASLVVPLDAGFYSISPPIADATRSVLRNEAVNHPLVATELQKLLDEFEDIPYRLELARLLYRAYGLSGGAPQGWATGYASDTMALAREYYRSQHYDVASRFAREVVNIRPANVAARELLVRALIQSERFVEAATENEELRKLGALGDFYFLEGLLARKRDKPREAIVKYKQALARGRGGLAIYREMAQCYYAEGDIELADQCLRKAQEIDPFNRFVIDLQVKVAILEGNEKAARDGLSRLEKVDEPAFLRHRQSTVELAFGDPQAAYRIAATAVSSAAQPRFHLIAQLANTEIETGRLEEARKHIEELEKRFPNSRTDVRLGIRCKWECAKKNFRNALALWQKIERKDTEVHRALGRDVYEGLLTKETLSDEERKKYGREFDKLKKGSASPKSFWRLFEA